MEQLVEVECLFAVEQPTRDRISLMIRHDHAIIDGVRLPTADPIGTGAVAASGPVMKKEVKETEYDSSGFKEVSIGKLAPDIRAMTVAVVIDESLVPDAAKEAEIESLVKNSIGWSSE